jgi:ParB-like chromosome segregation protein Spo0J
MLLYPRLAAEVTVSDVNITKVAVASIVLDPELQPRAVVSPQLVREYAYAMDAGAQFPPIVCFSIDGQLLLADGWHRLEAWKRLGAGEVEVDVREGGRDEALLFSREYNAKHGARFTAADKRRAIVLYLNHPRFGLWANREIARRLGVDHKSVAAHRLKLRHRQEGKPPPTTTASRPSSPRRTRIVAGTPTCPI